MLPTDGSLCILIGKMRDKAAKFSSLLYSIKDIIDFGSRGFLMCMEVKYKNNMRVNMKQQLTFAFEELICYEIKCSLSSPLLLVRQCLSSLNGRAATVSVSSFHPWNRGTTLLARLSRHPRWASVPARDHPQPPIRA